MLRGILASFSDPEGDFREAAVDLMRELVSRPALGPSNGGQGELEKLTYLQTYLESLGGFTMTRIDAPDERVASGIRPNLAAVLPGKDPSRTLWVIAHVDVVPPGDLSLWQTDPYSLAVDGDFLIGRGVEDNQSGMVSALLLARALVLGNVAPPVNYGVLLVADEETGNAYGLDHVLAERPDLFGEHDLILVPDFGTPDSSLVEVAEKSVLHVKVTVTGKQCHASTPDDGVNSLKGAAAMILALEELAERFPERDELFSPPVSTFEPTMKDANVPNINTIPGKDSFYVDCRVLPSVELDAVLTAMGEIAERVAAERPGISIEIEPTMRAQAAPPTDVTAPVVQHLLTGIEAVYDVKAHPGGIGGGTVASSFRERNIPVAVWATLFHNAHQPNERACISWLLKDAMVMAHVLYAA